VRLLIGGVLAILALLGPDADTVARIPQSSAPIVTVHSSAVRPSHIVLPILRARGVVN
jgi:hypothetical protein